MRFSFHYTYLPRLKVALVQKLIFLIIGHYLVPGLLHQIHIMYSFSVFPVCMYIHMYVCVFLLISYLPFVSEYHAIFITHEVVCVQGSHVRLNNIKNDLFKSLCCPIANLECVHVMAWR